MAPTKLTVTRAHPGVKGRCLARPFARFGLDMSSANDRRKNRQVQSRTAATRTPTAKPGPPGQSLGSTEARHSIAGPFASAYETEAVPLGDRHARTIGRCADAGENADAAGRRPRRSGADCAAGPGRANGDPIAVSEHGYCGHRTSIVSAAIGATGSPRLARQSPSSSSRVPAAMGSLRTRCSSLRRGWPGVLSARLANRYY